MQELIRIESVPAKLGANFEEVKARLQAELAKYDVIVTIDTLPDAKKLATELNQTAKAIDERRKIEVAAVSEPIRTFDNQMKELVTMCKDGRQKLLDQIKIFEDETREKIRALLEARRAELWEQNGIAPEFRRATYDDLVILTALTKAGNLAAKQDRELEARVLADKSLQDRTERRLLELENASYKAGLSAPLTRDHVAGFLMADDDTYAAELDRIIKAEILREQEAQRRMREKLEREQQEREAMREVQETIRRAQTDRNECLGDAQFTEEELELIPVAEPYEFNAIPETGETKCEQAPEPGKVRITVRATFRPEVPEDATDEQIAAALRKTMEAAGISTLQSIEIIR